jgi:hypothetical protein
VRTIRNQTNNDYDEDKDQLQEEQEEKTREITGTTINHVL